MRPSKPLGHKSYGHIPHFPGSRMGPADHKCSDGQLAIATEKARDKWDLVIVQEKLDGSNVSVAKIDGEIVPLTRAGYTAESSPFEQHHDFDSWALEPKQKKRFDDLLENGERLCGEWLQQAHGTRYKLPHEPFVAFDLMHNMDRLPYFWLMLRVGNTFVTPNVLHIGSPISIDAVMERLISSGGAHGALDKPEGAVWRVERRENVGGGCKTEFAHVDYLAKYVRPDKEDGIYLPEVSGKPPVYNWEPK